MRTARLPYRTDSAELFEAVADEPWAVFLDSGRPLSEAGRWDILAARPYATLVHERGITRIQGTEGGSASRADPLQLLRDLLAAVPAESAFPFAGGAIGYFGYDLSRTLGQLPDKALPAGAPPEMAVGLYDWAVLVDHRERSCHLLGADRDPATRVIWDDLVALFSRPPPPRRRSYTILAEARPDITPAEYRQAFARTQAYIRAGDCYQINLTQCFTGRVTGDHWALYQALRRANPAPHAGYLNFPAGRVLSSSPERFLELRGDQVATRPIKGTRPRSAGVEEDRARARELCASAKDMAENLMIVDLLRNDLGKVCRTGSVQVPELFKLESFANVHHLVSTVTGRLGPGRDALDLLRAAFPGGSITGAPKRRAMEIIEELERSQRGIYCGAIGYIGLNGDMDTSLAIRTLVIRDDSVSFGVGGGIVADSIAEDEYRECLDKAAPLLRVLGTEAAGDGLLG